MKRMNAIVRQCLSKLLEKQPYQIQTWVDNGYLTDYSIDIEQLIKRAELMYGNEPVFDGEVYTVTLKFSVKQGELE